MKKLLLLVTVGIVTVVAGAGLLLAPVLMMGFGARTTSSGDGAVSCTNFSVWVGAVPDEAKVLTRDQLGLARSIFDVTTQAGFGEDTNQAAVIAIMTAMQESTLGANPTTRELNGDDDAGPFQIRVRLSWHAETLTQALDPVYATRVFLLGHLVSTDEATRAKEVGVKEPNPAGYTIPGLKQITGWQQMRPNDAAQAVQRSAFPLAYGKHEAMARSLVAEMVGSSGPVLCGNTTDAASDCPATGNPAEEGLTPDALRLFRCIGGQWPQLIHFSTVRADSLPYHPSGRAVDFMIPAWQTTEGNALGWEIAHHIQTNAASFGVDHLIFDRKIWSTARAAQGWRSCASGSCYNGPNPTAAHQDHVHVTVAGDSAAPGPSTGTVLPLKSYTLTARFGQCGSAWSRCHTGLDFAAPTGTGVGSVQSGRVKSAGWGGAYGNLVQVDHGAGVVSYYAHLSKISVTVGQNLNAGQIIGAVGETGNAFGAHLHLEIRLSGTATDPSRWLTTKGVTP
ncbi:peptidase M23B [Mycobacteroides abscessus subsp. abscessus]|nr:peptidase M23B [Mycobacteroides abscessus subsp. abscessus]